MQKKIQTDPNGDTNGPHGEKGKNTPFFTTVVIVPYRGKRMSVWCVYVEMEEILKPSKQKKKNKERAEIMINLSGKK